MKTSIESIVIRDRKDNLGRYFCKNNVTIGATANPKHNQMYNNLFWVQAVRQEGGHRNEFSDVYRHCKYGKWKTEKIHGWRNIDSKYYPLPNSFFGTIVELTTEGIMKCLENNKWEAK